jgi:glycosyltransferase involved in cell wall biosynthesis
MKILFAHNRYQHLGGEDSVVNAEISLLKSKGHEVILYSRHNDEVKNKSNLSVAIETYWSNQTTKELSEIFKTFKPDVLHSHNTFPLISPSLYWVADKFKVPIIQTLHNFRLLCPQAMFLRDGHICEDCLGNVPWRAIAHQCYRGSTMQTAGLAGMLTSHRLIGTWKNKINTYIALTEFSKSKFIEGGIPNEKLVIKPNFKAVVKNDLNLQLKPKSDFLFVGRLSPEKGIKTLIDAINLHGNTFKCNVAGSGSEQYVFEKVRGINFLGQLSTSKVNEYMQKAVALIIPSIWYETFGMVIIESFSNGLPVIASNLGAMAEIIEDGKTGLLFEPNNSEDLAEKMLWAKNNPSKMLEMGLNAKAVFESKYSDEVNYNLLMEIYKNTIVKVKGF